MAWHVTVIPNYWPAMTLTKPFSAGCALPASLTSKTAKEIWGSSQMPLIYAFDMQASTVCLLGSVKTHLGKEETHPLLDSVLIMLRKLAGCPCGRNISFQNGRMAFPCTIPASTHRAGNSGKLPCSLRRQYSKCELIPLSAECSSQCYLKV